MDFFEPCALVYIPTAEHRLAAWTFPSWIWDNLPVFTWFFRLPAAKFAPVLFLLAFAVRLVVLVALRNPAAPPGRQAGADAVEFNQLALSLARGDGYALVPGTPTSFRAPGFPFALSLVYRAFSENYWLAYLFLVCLGALACVLIWLLGRELMPETGGRIAGLLGVFYFPHVYISTLLMSENLFAPLLAAGLLLLVRALKSRGALPAACAGLCLGCAALTRPFAALLLPLLAALLFLALVRHHRLRALAAATAFAAAFIAPVIPWAARNRQVHGATVLFTTNGGNTFYGSNNDLVVNDRRYLGVWVPTTILPHRDVIDSMPGEVSHDRKEWEFGLLWVREHAARMPLLSLYKLARLCLPSIESGNRKFVLLDSVLYLPYAVLYLLAIWRVRSDRSLRSPPWLALHLVIAATVVTTLVFYGLPRFRDANVAALMCYAALPLAGRIKAGARDDYVDRPAA